MEKFIYKEKLTSQKLNQMVDEIEGKYEKPSNGIPLNDLSEGVKTSLDKADTALQEHQDLSGIEKNISDLAQTVKDNETATSEAIEELKSQIDKPFVDEEGYLVIN